jgi:hypothetical protein
MRWSILALIGVVVFSPSCRNGGKAASVSEAIVWRSLGTWSGRGSMQTEPFLSDTGALRLQWSTSNEAVPGTGRFRVTVHSDVSGRALVVAVDTRGVGRQVSYVSEDPRPFFLAVDSSSVDWTLTADEAVSATTVSPVHR